MAVLSNVFMAQISTDKKKIAELLDRGVAEVIVREDLEKKLASGQQLRVKLGIDPTSPNLHLGRSIPLLKLRDFQQLGHKIVFIVGLAVFMVALLYGGSRYFKTLLLKNRL